MVITSSRASTYCTAKDVCRSFDQQVTHCNHGRIGYDALCIKFTHVAACDIMYSVRLDKHLVDWCVSHLLAKEGLDKAQITSCQ